MSLKGNTNEEKIWNYLKSKLGNNYGVAGLMGNLYAESGLKPNNLQNTYEKSLGLSDVQYTKKVNDGSYTNFINDKAGYGLAQWTYWSRKQKLLDYAKKKNKSIDDLEMQLDFLMSELKNYSTVINTLKNAKSVKEASNIVLFKFEAPADQGEKVQNTRASYGQNYYNKYVVKTTEKEEGGKVTMEIVKSILTKNPCYTAGRTITVKGLMLHSVGCPQPSAQAFINNWNSPSYDRACVHGFIDANNGKVYQTLPWNRRGWHAGGTANNTHIGVEMCEPSQIKYTGGSSFTCTDKTAAKAAAKRTYNSAVQLFAYLCKEYKLNPLGNGVIVSHKEGCARGIASNHGDPEHLWKGLGLSYTMDTFRKDVKKAMEGNKTTTKTETKKPTTTVKKDTSKVVVNYKVKVTADALRIRGGAGTKYAVKGVIKDKGIYTIVETKNNWGKLKSGAGWICLDYTKRV